MKPLTSPSNEDLIYWNQTKVFRHLELSSEVAYTLSVIACGMAGTSLLLSCICLRRFLKRASGRG